MARTMLVALTTSALLVLPACASEKDSDQAAAPSATQQATTPESTSPPSTPASTPAPTADVPSLEDRAAQSNDGTLLISRVDFGDQWPFTVKDGLLSCRRVPPGAIVFGPGNTAYAVNGTAQAGAEEYGWKKDIAPVWADNPKIAGTKKNMGPVTDLGLKLCRQ